MFQGRWQSVEFVFTRVLKKGWALRLFAFCTWNITTPGWLSPSCEVSLECKIQSTSSSCCQGAIIDIPSADVRSSSIYTNTHCSMYRTAYASPVCTVLSMPIIIQYTKFCLCCSSPECVCVSDLPCLTCPLVTLSAFPWSVHRPRLFSWSALII